ncbi:MAG TPA: enoyl-CoA hydratase-related protein [Candidatus Binataceae bacterium]|nr:enoyl-CoA hydratase-related protein [Candidatus Binataceae bacterium]
MSVDLVIANSVAEIVLNRPAKMNAFDDAMVAALNERLGEAERAAVRALIIRGEGPGFSAGRDLGDAAPGTEDAETIVRTVFNPVIRRIANFPAPSFAAVHGPCLGAGLGIALACDVVYIADDAKIGSPFARIGAVLDSGGHAFFVERLGSHRALELMYTGRLLSGAEAAAAGLVNRAFARDAVLGEMRKLAAQVAAGPTAALMESKRIVRRILDEHPGLDEVLAAEARAQGAAGRTADYKEGITAFQEKRPPKFSGR